MRVAIDLVIFQMQNGRPLGVSRIWNEILPRLVAMSPDIEFVFYRRAGSDFPVFSHNGNCKINVLPPYTWGEEVVRSVQADLFISTYYTYAEGIRNLLYVYDMIPEQLGWTGFEWTAKQIVLERADKIVVMSRATERALYELAGREVSRKCVGIVPGGVSLDHFYPANALEIKEFRDRFHIPEKYIMLAGRRGQYKNGDTIWKALELIDDVDLHVLLAGGEEPMPLNMLGAEAVGDTYYFTHMDDDLLRPAYSGAAAFYYPSSHEGFGLPVLEAMACGCPVILGPAKAIREFGVGILVDEPNRAENVVDALLAIQVPRERENLIAAGLQRAKEYSWEQAVTQLRKAILEY